MADGEACINTQDDIRQPRVLKSNVSSPGLPFGHLLECMTGLESMVMNRKGVNSVLRVRPCRVMHYGADGPIASVPFRGID